MNALQVMDRYRKEAIQVSTRKHAINVQYLYDTLIEGLQNRPALASSEFAK